MTTQALREGRQNPHEKSAKLAHHILNGLFKKYLGAFTIMLWDNSVMYIGKDISAFTLSVRSPWVIGHAASRSYSPSRSLF